MVRMIPKRIYLYVFVLFIVTYAYFFQGGGWCQNTRICLTRAVIDRHTFIIDAYREDSKDPYFEFVNTGDWAYCNGHYYTNKSPGLSFMAVAPFALAQLAAKKIYPGQTERQVHLSAYVSTVLTVGLCSALLCLLIFYVTGSLFRLSLNESLLLAAFFGFGTMVFPYGTTFYCHLPAAFFAFLALVLVMLIRHNRTVRKKGAAMFAGFCASTAVLIEPSSVFCLGFVFLYLAGFAEGRKLLHLFLLGCAPPGLVQIGYNAACFGGPLQSSYLYSNPEVMFKEGGSLFGAPRPETVARLLVFPYRGLLVSSPVLLMALPGLIICFFKREWVAETAVCLGISVVFLLFIASVYAWYGGSAPGPRYLLPAYPFCFLLSPFALRKFPKTFIAVGAVSIAINLSITLVGNEIPGDIRNPLKDVVLKNLIEGKASINPVPFSNFNEYPNIYDMADISKWQPNFNSFNLGDLLFPHHPASVLPLIAFWIVWWIVWRKKFCAPPAG